MESDSVDPTKFLDRSDEELVKLAQKGSTESLDALLKRHWANSMKHALWRYQRGSDRDAEDLCQEAWLTACTKLNTFGPPYHFLGWLKGIIDNKVKGWWQQNQKEEEIFGTKRDPDHINNIEDTRDYILSVEAKDVVNLVVKKLARLKKERDRKVGEFMLEHWKENNGRFPTVDDIEVAMKISHGVAQRCRERFLKIWRKAGADGSF